MEDVGNQAASNSAYDYANLAAAMDDGDVASSEGGQLSLYIPQALLSQFCLCLAFVLCLSSCMCI